MSHWVRQRVSLAGLALLIGSLTACSGDDAQDAPEPESQASSAAPSLATTAKVGVVAGKLPRAKRRGVVDEVGKVVDGWIDAAHVAGDFPRTIGSEAWSGFTPQAAKLASKDKALTSAAEISEQVESVTATRRVVRYDVLAARGRAHGVTARVVLNYDTTGESQATVRVRGRLMLTRTKNGWKIFGYDLTEGKR